MIGFTYNSQQEFCAVLVQPYVRDANYFLNTKYTAATNSKQASA